ncbi:hypothetical protein OCU04_001187 [Sclerotinia nivalis]|uniref:Uncharacterized protein n=1 Tax=Sclerotinia nivalis TaxID=352851 RepID=A0A9X0AXM2_9HELO|nr:hypothetical protein OCU04_001187 [Sclerotinia nivalis]
MQSTENEVYQQKAAAYYDKNMKQSGGSSPEKFYSVLRLAECQYPGILDWKDIPEIEDAEWAKIEDSSVKALTYRTKQAQPPGSRLDSERCCAAFLLKALALYKSGKMDEAIETYESALSPGTLEYCKGINNTPTFVVVLYAEKDKYREVIARVCEQHPRFKYEWLLWHRSSQYTDKSDVLRKAAVLTRRVDILINLYKEAINYWQKIDYRYAEYLQ